MIFLKCTTTSWWVKDIGCRFFLNCYKNEDFIGKTIFKMTLTSTYDFATSDFLMCYYFSMSRTHWWSIFFSNRSINKGFIGHASILTSQGQMVCDIGNSLSNSACQQLSVDWFWAKSLLEFESEYFSFMFVTLTL